MNAAAYMTTCPNCKTIQQVGKACGTCGRPITMKDFNRKLGTGEDLEKSEREQELKNELAFMDQRVQEKVESEDE